jgi:hypothetical protein
LASSWLTGNFRLTGFRLMNFIYKAVK